MARGTTRPAGRAGGGPSGPAGRRPNSGNSAGMGGKGGSRGGGAGCGPFSRLGCLIWLVIIGVAFVAAEIASKNPGPPQ